MIEVTVHFFKESGKWYTTETCLWTQDAQAHVDSGNWREAVRAVLPVGRLTGMVAVVVDSPLGFPAMVVTV